LGTKATVSNWETDDKRNAQGVCGEVFLERGKSAEKKTGLQRGKKAEKKTGLQPFETVVLKVNL
jgi:hypothetical protein